MNKKMFIFVSVILIVAAAGLGLWYVAFCQYGIGPAFPFMPQQHIPGSEMEEIKVDENALAGAADSEQQAQEIAEQYGIELISYENGIAVYHTDEDPYEVIARGEENGYPPLSINYIRTTMP